jgi:DNA-binding transcriptional LysR family regulator
MDSNQLMRHLRLHDLRVLMTVVQAGSMLKAAQRLNTSQPAISRVVAEVERKLGVRLLDRSRHGVEPTIYGQALIDCGTAVFDELSQGARNIKFLAEPAEGELRIAGDAPAIAGVLPATINRFRRKHPRIDIHVALTNEVAQQQRVLRERSRDLIFARIGELAARDLEAEVLFQETSVVVAAERSPWTRRRKINLRELAGEPWAIPTPDSVIGALAVQAFRRSGLDFPPQGAVTGSLQLGNVLVACGDFLGLLPASSLHFAPKGLGLKVLPVKVPIPPTPFGIVRLKGRTLDPIARLFVECAREVTKPLAQLSSTSRASRS